MSPQAQILKAKLEAVIYAAEEPVTLAQLIGLLGEEAQQDLDSQQPSLALEDEGSGPAEPTNDADALNAEVLSESGAGPVDMYAVGEPANPAVPAEPAASDDRRAQRELETEAKLKAKRLRDYFRSLLDSLMADYASPARGLEIREVAGGFRLATKPEFHDAVRGFVKSLKPPLKLSLQALETLAVVAYKQPVTAPEVSEIRGVDSAGVLGSLLTRKLVTTAGRKHVIGRPILYKTTKEFLVRFGLKDINELPSIEEFEKMAGELNETLLDDIHATEAPTEEPEEPEETEMEAPPAEPQDAHGTPSLDEAHAVPPPTHMHHDTPEDLMADDSTHPEGAKHEPAGE